MSKTLRTLTDADFTTKGNTLTHSELDQNFIDLWDKVTDGAQNISINNQTVNGFIDLDQISTPANPSGNIARLYNVDEGGFSTLHYVNSSGIDFELSRDAVQIVRNNSGAAISQGEAVYITGSNGNFPTVDLADASDRNKIPAYGVAVQDISDNSFGEVLTRGDASGFDLSSFSEGDTVYLSASTPGGITGTEPTGDNVVQIIGEVIKNTASGILAVRPATIFDFQQAGLNADFNAISINGTNLFPDDDPQALGTGDNVRFATGAFGTSLTSGSTVTVGGLIVSPDISGEERLRFIGNDTSPHNPFISWYNGSTRQGFFQYRFGDDQIKLANEYGSISFLTHPDGTSGEIERMRIHGGGGVSIGTASLTAGNVFTAVGDADIQGDLEVTGTADIATAQIDTLRTTLFKPETVSGMGGEFVASAVSQVVSIDTGSNTITVEDEVFDNGDDVVVSSGAYGVTGFSNVFLSITSGHSGSAGSYTYSYSVDSGTEGDIGAGDTVSRLNGDSIYINATNAGDSPAIKGFDNLANGSDHPINGGSASPVWELTATGGIIGGYNIDSTHLWTEDGSQTAGTFSGMIQRGAASTKVFFAGADDKDGDGSLFHILADGTFFSSQALQLVYQKSDAATGSDNDSASITPVTWTTTDSSSGGDFSTNQQVKLEVDVLKKPTHKKLKIYGSDSDSLSVSGTTGGIGITVTAKITAQFVSYAGTNTATVTSGGSANSKSFTLEVDIGSMTDGTKDTLQVVLVVEVDGNDSNDPGDTNTVTGELKDNILITLEGD